MQKHPLLYTIVAGLLVLLMIMPASAAQFAPAVFAIEQDVVDDMVTVTRVTSNVTGWIVIHADDNGAPGPVLGQTAVPSGITADVRVEIDTEGLTEVLWAMLHVDEGVEGEYEFPGADVPVVVNEEIVMAPFVVGEVTQSIVGIASSTDGFSTLVQAVDAAGLVDTLQNDGPFTVFAPTDEAFAAVPVETLDALLNDPAQLTQVLLYHVVPGAVMAADVTDGLEAETAQGELVTFAVADGAVTINEANIVATDIVAANGVIHVIDQVLLPPAPEVEAAAEEAPAEEAATEETAAEETTTEETATDETATTEEATTEEADEIVPAVIVGDQTLDGQVVTVAAVTAAQAGWMVIHADDSGAPGTVLGQTRVSIGESTDVLVGLEEAVEGEVTLWAMLHVDEGEAGIYEFPGPDGPVLLDDAIVMASFTATATAVEEEETLDEASEEAAPVEEETTEETPATDEEAAEEATVNAAATDETASITVIDQGSSGNNVAVLQAVLTQAGWLVIYSDENDAPGQVLGQTNLPWGTTANIIVTLEEPISGETKLWAMLHADEGEVGVFEFPGSDVPLTADGEAVMASFTAIVTGDDEAVVEAAAAPVEDPTPVPTATSVPAPTPVPTATPVTQESMVDDSAMADDSTMAAPAMLPETGFSMASNTAHLPVVLLVMVALFGAAVITRRRS